MRTVHRLFSILALFVMLYLGVTGSLIQIIDLKALLSHAPETNPTITSINEGKDGNGDYAVRSDQDLVARSLPANLDYEKAFRTVLQALHTAEPKAEVRYAEVRMNGDKAQGQIATGPIPDMGAFFAQTQVARAAGQRPPPPPIQPVSAFDALTGADAPVITIGLAEPLPSLRQSLKDWHRMWARGDKPGVYFELLFGLLMWLMIVTGLTYYFSMLKQRRELGRKQIFWKSGGIWRMLHRWISVSAALFLIVIAGTGTWLGFESSWHTFQPQGPADSSRPLNDKQVLSMVHSTLMNFRSLEAQTPIKVLRVRSYGGTPQGVVITGGDILAGGETTRQLVFNTATGAQLSLTEPGYPASQFPFGLRTHEFVKHLHSGFNVGVWSRFFYLYGGISLIYLSISGIVMYIDMWRLRVKAGKRGWMWI